ncbi:SspB family protein [Pseudahrensia aquimaris]|uniref:SspB family protein n=1 Tax=Pseudahrensia aquimaris TaxID=744461 RepID=A0ABW3FN98_9HYPH
MADLTDTPEVEDLIRYDILAQEALRGVVKKVLHEVARIGTLPGEHHFYITFDTSAPGVKLSPRMKAKYPEEMTIVVQHQFWDLKTTDNGFSIGLSFNEIPETLVVPYSAIRGFFDPAVQFGLQFDADETEGAEDTAKALESGVTPLPALENANGKKAQSDAQNDSANTEDGHDTDDDGDGSSAEVVSLDAFRKK